MRFNPFSNYIRHSALNIHVHPSSVLCILRPFTFKISPVPTPTTAGWRCMNIKHWKCIDTSVNISDSIHFYSVVRCSMFGFVFIFVFSCCSPSIHPNLIIHIERWTMNNETVHQSCYNVIHTVYLWMVNDEKSGFNGFECMYGSMDGTIYHSPKLWVTDCTLAIKTEKLFGSNRQYMFRFRTGITYFWTSFVFETFVWGWKPNLTNFTKIFRNVKILIFSICDPKWWPHNID